MKLLGLLTALAFALVGSAAAAADYPAPKQGDWIAHNFKFHTGEVMPELRRRAARATAASPLPATA